MLILCDQVDRGSATGGYGGRNIPYLSTSWQIVISVGKTGLANDNH